MFRAVEVLKLADLNVAKILQGIRRVVKTVQNVGYQTVSAEH
jgi:hypothetical protein